MGSAGRGHEKKLGSEKTPPLTPEFRTTVSKCEPLLKVYTVAGHGTVVYIGAQQYQHVPASWHVSVSSWYGRSPGW
eukprot:scaffold53780_cov73-Phaeocystis_antarctica.AAC.1